MAKFSFLFESEILSSELNKRFGDLLGGSILEGFRLVLGTKSFSISVSKQNDANNVLITNSGVRIEESEDATNALTVLPNDHISNTRIDAVYVVYIHDSIGKKMTYITIPNFRFNEYPQPIVNDTHTLLGFIHVPPRSESLQQKHLESVPNGVKKWTFGNGLEVHKNFTLDGFGRISGDMRVGGDIEVGGDLVLTDDAVVEAKQFALVSSESRVRYFVRVNDNGTLISTFAPRAVETRITQLKDTDGNVWNIQLDPFNEFQTERDYVTNGTVVPARLVFVATDGQYYEVIISNRGVIQTNEIDDVSANDILLERQFIEKPSAASWYMLELNNDGTFRKTEIYNER